MAFEPRRAAPWLSAAFALAALHGCGGNDGTAPSPVALTCDDSMKSAFKPDANTQVVLVKAFKQGDPLALAGTTGTPPTCAS